MTRQELSKAILENPSTETKIEFLKVLKEEMPKLKSLPNRSFYCMAIGAIFNIKQSIGFNLIIELGLVDDWISSGFISTGCILKLNNIDLLKVEAYEALSKEKLLCIDRVINKLEKELK